LLCVRTEARNSIIQTQEMNLGYEMIGDVGTRGEMCARQLILNDLGNGDA
jgi:hypothetical protein